MLVYMTEGKIPGKELYNKRKNPGIVKIGMLSEVRIVARKRKVLNVVLEKLDLIDL